MSPAAVHRHRRRFESPCSASQRVSSRTLGCGRSHRRLCSRVRTETTSVQISAFDLFLVSESVTDRPRPHSGLHRPLRGSSGDPEAARFG